MVLIKPAGDSAVVIVISDEIDEKINKKVHSIANAVENKISQIEVVPTYGSIYVYYDPLKISYSELVYKLNKYISFEEIKEERRVIEIPVVYGGEFGPDLNFVASYNNLSIEEVIKLHTSRLYRVYMLGFLPGFAYLGGMDKRISVPRLKTPRIHIPAGSVGIGENQTGWYAIESPGGWRIIGRTPLKTFDPDRIPPSKVLPGDYVRFKSINEKEFYKIYELEWGDSYY